MVLLNPLSRPAADPPAPRRGVLGRLWRARGGASAVEMAFLLPVFMLFILGICEFGRALWTQTALQFAVEAAARCAAVSPSLCTATGGSSMDVPGYAASQAFGMTDPVERLHLHAERDLRRYLRRERQRRRAGHRQLCFRCDRTGARPGQCHAERQILPPLSLIHLGENITVTPAEAGVQGNHGVFWHWIPAYAGMTIRVEAAPLQAARS